MQPVYHLILPPPGLGLPTVGVDAMCALAVSRHLNLNVAEIPCGTGHPQLRSIDNVTTATGLSSILDFIAADPDIALDPGLSPRRKVEAVAVANLVRLRASALFDSMAFASTVNYPVTAKVLGDKIPLIWRPFKIFQLRRHVRLSCADPALYQAVVVDGLGAVQSAARALFELVTNLLKDRPFIMGTEETVADAIVFGSLACLVSCTLPANPVASLLNDFPVVSRWLDDQRARLFSDMNARSSTALRLRPAPASIVDTFAMSGSDHVPRLF